MKNKIHLSDNAVIKTGEAFAEAEDFSVMGIVEMFINDHKVMTRQNMVTDYLLEVLAKSLHAPTFGFNIRPTTLLNESLINPGGSQDDRDGIAIRRVRPSVQGDVISVQTQSLTTTIESSIQPNSVRFKGTATLPAYQSDPDNPDFIDAFYLGRGYTEGSIFQQLFAILNSNTESGSPEVVEDDPDPDPLGPFRYDVYDDDVVTIFWQLLVI